MNWSDLLSLGGFIVVWFVLMRFVLPKLGIPTCMSGYCGLPPEQYKQQETKKEDLPLNKTI